MVTPDQEKRILPLDAASDSSDEGAIENRIVVMQVEPTGSSGVQNFSGYSTEEYLSALTGTDRADIFDKMRRGESQIKMVLSSVKNPIKKAVWTVEPAEDTPEAKLHAEFAEHVLFEDMGKTWRRFLGEALTVVDHGHSVFEVTHKLVTDHPKFGTYHGIKQLGWRSPRTLYRWNLDKATGALLSVSQQSQGDLGRQVDMDARFLLIFSIDQEGDNYEGISMLRPCYGAWSRKNLYLKLQAIGSEKYAVPTPVLHIPKNMENSPEKAAAEASLRAYTSHQKAFLTIPAGWEVDFPASNFDPDKLQTTIDSEDRSMVKAFLANFLELGMSSAGGSYALSFDQSDFFLSGIEFIADEIVETINLSLIKQLILMKYGPQQKYPKLKHSGISDALGQEWSIMMKNLVDSKVITPDDPLEASVRKRLKLPEKSDLGQRQPAPAFSPGGAPPSAPSTGKDLKDPKPKGDEPKADEKEEDAEGAPTFSEFTFADKSQRQALREAAVHMRDIMQSGLRIVSQNLIKQMITKARGLPKDSRAGVPRSVEAKGKAAYRAALADFLAILGGAAVEQARSEVPGMKSFEFADVKLPKKLTRAVALQAEILADSQIADLEKAIYFQFASSIESTDSLDLVAKDVAGAAEGFIEGPSVLAGAGNVSATIINAGRNAFFFEPAVLEEIASFSFVNGDPVSPICQDLAGTTFDKDDPEAQRYFPPLHHNCKSFIVPNLSGSKKEISEIGLKPSSPELDKFVTLGEG